jgi:hypothetical protein
MRNCRRLWHASWPHQGMMQFMSQMPDYWPRLIEISGNMRRQEAPY